MDFHAMIRGLREPAHPRISELWDVFRSPNDVLLSYLLEEIPDLGHGELVTLLREPDALQNLLAKDFFSEPQSLPSELQALDVSFSAYIRNASNRVVAICNGNEVLMGKPSPKSHTYPNGDSLDYFLVTDEVSANMPISTTAFCLSHPARLYVRQNGMKMMRALADVACSQGYVGRVDNFGYAMLGIVLSHEEVEAGLLEDPAFEDLPLLERELRVEQQSRAQLAKKGISDDAYQMFHTLRSMGTEQPQGNVSYNVLQNSQPLSS